MIENSSAGLVLLNAEVSVTVTREEDHQSVLARYPVAAGGQRHVAVELGRCTIGSGKYRGQPAIEVRLDGHRVGELTHAMSQRYAALVMQVAARGGRPGCEAVIHHDTKGLQLTLRLPRDNVGTIPFPAPGTTAMAPEPPARRRRRIFSSHRPAWIAAAIVAITFFGALANNGDDPSRSKTTATDVGVTTAAALPATATRPTSTTTTPPVTTTTTTVVAAVPEPADPQPPSPKTTTKRTTTPAAPAPPPPPAEPAPRCDPNYSGCVPIASDVDCAGGSGDGPAYVKGPIQVIGTDIYRLDADHDGIACE